LALRLFDLLYFELDVSHFSRLNHHARSPILRTMKHRRDDNPVRCLIDLIQRLPWRKKKWMAGSSPAMTSRKTRSCAIRHRTLQWPQRGNHNDIPTTISQIGLVRRRAGIHGGARRLPGPR
jgi:hypothetical protein